MKLFGQLCILAICIYAVSGVSIGTLENARISAGQVLGRARRGLVSDGIAIADNAANTISHLIGSVIPALAYEVSDPSAPTADTCYSSYTAQLSSINNATKLQTQNCYISSQGNYSQNVNASLVKVLTLSQQLQAQLAACAAGTDIDSVLSCYLSTFDANLKNLDDLTMTSQLAATYMGGYQSQLQVQQTGCINSAILASKSNSSVALNTLENCLDSVNGPTSSSSSSVSISASDAAVPAVPSQSQDGSSGQAQSSGASSQSGAQSQSQDGSSGQAQTSGASSQSGAQSQSQDGSSGQAQTSGASSQSGAQSQSQDGSSGQAQTSGVSSQSGAQSQSQGGSSGQAQTSGASSQSGTQSQSQDNSSG